MSVLALMVSRFIPKGKVFQFDKLRVMEDETNMKELVSNIGQRK